MKVLKIWVIKHTIAVASSDMIRIDFNLSADAVLGWFGSGWTSLMD